MRLAGKALVRNLEAGGDGERHVHRPRTLARAAADANDRQAASSDLLAILPQNGTVANRLPGLLGHLQVDIELILELQRFLELEGRGHARPSDLGVAGGDAEARRAPHRVLGFLDVLEEVGEVNDAGRVGFRKPDLPVIDVLADGRHDSRRGSQLSAISKNHHVYRTAVCSGLKNRGSRLSTLSNPSR